MKNILRFLFTVVVFTAACADAMYDENVTTIQSDQRCTNCCRACTNYNGPGEYCWWVPCVVNETETDLWFQWVPI